MANVLHSSLTTTDLHEPKGVAAATSGQVYVANGAGSGAWTTPTTPTFMQKHIAGLTYSNAADATNDFTILAGSCRDTTNTEDMILSASITKRIDATWVVGDNQGGLDTGAVGNNTYHIWLIKRPDTGVVDALFSLSASSPTMPTNYTKKRRIGSFQRISGANQLLTTYESDGGGVIVSLTTPSGASPTAPDAGAVTTISGVPTGISFEIKVFLSEGGSTPVFVGNATQTGGTGESTPNLPLSASNVFEVITNTSAQIFLDSDVGASALTGRLLSWKDFRRD